MRHEVWLVQMSVDKRSIALKLARPFGLREKSRHAVLEDLAREHHYLRPPPSLARFFAATRLATKWEQTLAPKIQAKPRPTGTPAHRQGAGGPVYSGAIMDFTMKRLFTAFVAMLAVSALLAGCGQKGPLYLPEESQPAPAQTE